MGRALWRLLLAGMTMRPSGWYPDRSGVRGWRRWGDGSTWTQHTHTGTAGEPPDASGPVTSLDATRIGAASNEAPRTAIDRLVPQPTTVQPAVAQPTMIQPTTVQPPLPAVRPGAPLDRTQVQASVAHPGIRQPGTGSSSPGAGPSGGYRGAGRPHTRG